MALPSNETHNTKRRKEPYHEQDQTHRGLRRSRIRRCRVRRRTHGWRRDRASPSSPPSPPLEDAAATSSASASLGDAASSTASSTTASTEALLAITERECSRPTSPPRCRVSGFSLLVEEAPASRAETRHRPTSRDLPRQRTVRSSSQRVEARFESFDRFIFHDLSPMPSEAENTLPLP